MTENPLGYEKIPKLLKNFAVPSIVASLIGSIYNIVDQIFIGRGVEFWEMQQPMFPTRFLPSALPLHYWSELAVLPVFPSFLDAKSRKLPPKQREWYCSDGNFRIIYLLVGETFLPLLLKGIWG